MAATRQHIHPLTIFANLWRVLYLTIIPVLRGFFLALRGNLGQWLQGAWMDILVFLLMIALAVFRWWLVTYHFDAEGIAIDLGWLLRRHIHVPWERITTTSAVESFYLRPFRAVRLRADTLGGGADKADFTILLSHEQAERILERGRGQGSGRPPREYVPQTSSILALSLLTSNSLGGIIFMATFISQSGKLLGNEFSDLLIGTFEEAARLLAFGLPPAAAATSYILLSGWLIAFLLTFLRYKNFVVSRSGGTLNVSGGMFTRREYCIRYSDINFIDIRQSVATKVLNLHSLYISAVGYAKQKNDISCIIPTENRRVFSLNRERLFPAFSPTHRQIAPKITGFMRFTGVALFICAAIPLATWLLCRHFPGWRSFILFVGLMLMLPALFFLIVRIIDFSTAGIARSGKFYTLRYSKGFYLHTVVIPEDKIVGFELKQSPIQRLTPNCDLIVYTRAETRFSHCCRNLNKARIQEFLHIYNQPT